MRDTSNTRCQRATFFKVASLVFSLVMLAAWLASCREREEPPASAQRPRYAVIPKCVTYDFWKEVRQGALSAANEIDAELIWEGTLKENDVTGQIAILNQMIAEDVDGIVLAPIDAEALADPVREATESGIPVVIIDSALNADSPISFIATDNENGGRIAGEHLAGLLGGEGRVTLLRFQKGSASTESRAQGFLQAIAAAPGIDAVETDHYGGVTPESAYAESEALLRTLTSETGVLQVDGIFCSNESTTIGMLRALDDAGLSGQVRIVGFDSSPFLLEALKEKRIDALVIQAPHSMGYLGVKTLHQHLRGEMVEKRIDTGARLITAP